jgi:putative two-component system response regulator
VSDLLLVDDDLTLRRWEQRVLEDQGYVCQIAGDGPEAQAALSNGEFALALLDVNLPGQSGIDLLAHIRQAHPQTAVLMVTGEDDLALATRAIELGAYGYLVKPVRAGELVINVVNALHRRRRDAELRQRVTRLEWQREEAEQQLRRLLVRDADDAELISVLESDTARRLMRVAEFRDEETGQHMARMGLYCELLARRCGLPEDDCTRLRRASELHDIGKIAIPDRILLKPGRLTGEERRVMQTHSKVGYRLLADGDSDLLRTAALTALTHHERWDGSGYPRGLAGERVPVQGRIAAVADVFDALTSDRVYRPAFPVGMALEMMESERGRQFAPVTLDALHDSFDEIERVRRSYPD